MGSTHKTAWSETRPHRVGEFFRSLASDALREFQEHLSLVCYPPHALLFEEQREASSILILVEGCAKISVNSIDGKRLILWIARPMELLGLTPVVRGSCHETTAETVHPCRIASIRRQEFLDFLVRYPAVYQGIARELSVEMSRACEQMRIMGLSPSASIKLALAPAGVVGRRRAHDQAWDQRHRSSDARRDGGVHRGDAGDGESRDGRSSTAAADRPARPCADHHEPICAGSFCSGVTPSNASRGFLDGQSGRPGPGFQAPFREE